VPKPGCRSEKLVTNHLSYDTALHAQRKLTSHNCDFTGAIHKGPTSNSGKCAGFVTVCGTLHNLLPWKLQTSSLLLTVSGLEGNAASQLLSVKGFSHSCSALKISSAYITSNQPVLLVYSVCSTVCKYFSYFEGLTVYSLVGPPGTWNMIILQDTRYNTHALHT
jgi:hypothetical protein